MNYMVTTIEKLPDDEEKVSILNKQTWPEFLRHGDDHHWGEIFKTFPEFQILFISGNNLAGVGHTVPLYWNNENDHLPNSVEEIILSGIECHDSKQPPNTLAAIAVMVSKHYRSKGLSTKIVTAMKQSSKKNNLNSLIVPVRPTLKKLLSHYAV